MNALWIVYIVLAFIAVVFIEYIAAILFAIVIIVAGLTVLIKRRFWE